MNDTLTAAAAPIGAVNPPWHERLKDGTEVLIRALGHTDAALELDFLAHCSPQARRYRFLASVQPTPELAQQLTTLDPARDVALVAIWRDQGEAHAVGVTRCRLPLGDSSAECAILVRDDMQGRGLGVVLMRHLVDVARSRGVRKLMSIDSAENHGMRDLAAYFGFERVVDPDDAAQVILTLAL